MRAAVVAVLLAACCAASPRAAAAAGSRGAWGRLAATRALAQHRRSLHQEVPDAEVDVTLLPVEPTSEQASAAADQPASGFLSGGMDTLNALGQLMTGLARVAGGQTGGGGGKAAPRASAPGRVDAFSIQGSDAVERAPAVAELPGTLLPELASPTSSAEQQQILQQIVDTVTGLLGTPPAPDPQRVAALGMEKLPPIAPMPPAPEYPPPPPLPPVPPTKPGALPFLTSSPPPPPTDVTPIGSQPTSAGRIPASALVRQPGLLPLVGCLEDSSVVGMGVPGDGATEVAALLAGLPTAMPILYFPPGVYRVGANVTLPQLLVMGTATSFYIDEGAALTLLQQPKRVAIVGDAAFRGPGRVRIAYNGEVYPDWWSAPDVPDSELLQTAADSCDGPCSLIFSRGYNLNTAVYLNPNNAVFSTRGSRVVGGNGPGEGLVLRPGQYDAPILLTSLQSFSSFALKVQGGVSGADIQLGSLYFNWDGLVFDATSGSTSVVANVTVSHFSVAQKNQHTIVFNATTGDEIFYNVTVRGNFIVTGGQRAGWEALPSSGVVFRGAAPQLEDTAVVVQAIDPAQFLTLTRFTAVRTATSSPVSNFVFKIECWSGGFRPPSQIITGAFSNSQFLVSMSGDTHPSYVMTLTGENNVLRVGSLGSASRDYVMPQVPDSSLFLNGLPFGGAQVTYVRAPVSTDWRAGQVRTFYLYSQYAQTAAADEMRCIPFRATNSGLVCKGFENQSKPGNPYQIALRVINKSGRVIPAGQAFRFGVQIGP